MSRKEVFLLVCYDFKFVKFCAKIIFIFYHVASTTSTTVTPTPTPSITSDVVTALKQSHQRSHLRPNVIKPFKDVIYKCL
jgi:hypothetical protein